MLAHCPPSPCTLRAALSMAASGLTALGVVLASTSAVCGDTTAADGMQADMQLTITTWTLTEQGLES